MSTLRAMCRISHSGRLQWKVSLTAGQEKYDSPAFYTGIPGYKMHVTLELKGHRERDQDFASVFVILEKGDFDEDLFFPLNASCRVRVLSERVESEGTEIQCSNIPRSDVTTSQRGRLRFMPTARLLSDDFCTNNCLYLDIKVKT